ncbi:MbcA/ParS/Xre antitoxin family protein [Streptomyces sp. NPDC047081]|uniref:MbcA/ParS/Xre antitoxin family protein n=1 Tax=Bacteria TaxID=2 RepID=UPI0033DF045B
MELSQNGSGFSPADLSLPAESQEALDLALGLFGNKQALAMNWLNTPVLGLGNKKPAELLQTEPGRKRVIEFIWRLENGAGI